MASSEVQQIAAFEQRFAQAQATEVVDLAWGFALLQRDFPYSYDHNRIVVTSAASSAEILAQADAVLGGSGLDHRYVSVIDDTLGRDLSADFVAAGFEHEMITTMIYRGEPGGAGSPAHPVQAVSLDVLRPALIRQWEIDLPDSTDEVLAQLADRSALYSNGAEVTFLAVLEGDEIAARVDLFIDSVDNIAQLENLMTLPDYRGRGYAKSLVNEALGRSRAAGCRLAFLEADLDDWPRQWYARIGYVDSRQTHNFIRTS